MKVHSNISLVQETRETSNKQPNFTSKATIKRRKEELQSQQKERNHKIRAEITEKEMETIAKMNKTKSWFFEKINKQTISQTHQKKKLKYKTNQIRNEN